MLSNPTHRGERDALLRRIELALSSDSRIAAAWLFGSLGRGDSDDFSDIDLWIVVNDEKIEALLNSREAFIAEVAAGPPSLVVGAPQNAPAGGGYLLTLFSRPAGLQQVNWYWQPRSSASVGSDTLMLFERQAIPRATLPQIAASVLGPPLSPSEGREAALAKIDFFWAMLPTACKKIARGQGWEALGMTLMLRNILIQTSELMAAPQACAAMLALLPPHGAAEQFALMTQMALAMEELMSIAEKQGAVGPTSIVPEVYSMIDLLRPQSS